MPNPLLAAENRILPALVTPLLPDGRLDERSAERLVDHLYQKGVGGLYVTGSTGEGIYLENGIRKRIVEIAIAGSKGRGGHGFRAHPGPGHQRAFKAHPGFRGHVKFFGPRRHFHKHVAPPVVLFAPAPIYVAPPAYYWYWCQNPAGYYPYVPQCLGAWIPVVPH